MKHVIKKAPKKIIDDKKEATINELIEVFGALGFEVRMEKGTFKGGFCLLRERKLFLLNKTIEQDKKISFLLRNLYAIGTEGIFIKPGIREMMEREMENAEQE